MLPLTSDRVRVHATSDTPAPTGSGTLLVVDDEEAVRASARLLLEHLGYEVLLAVDGQDALRVFDEHGDRVRAVLLDMVMPRLSGPACLRELRKRNPDVRVILTTGYSLDAAGALVGHGAGEVLKKPFRTVDLARALARVLGG